MHARGARSPVGRRGGSPGLGAAPLAGGGLADGRDSSGRGVVGSIKDGVKASVAARARAVDRSAGAHGAGRPSQL
jgi:hypothetical protein